MRPPVVCQLMRVLFATTPDAGHFGPLVPFAHACLRAGHEVLVVGHAGAQPLENRATLRFAMAGLAPDPQARSARSHVLTMAPASLEGQPAPFVQRFRDPAVDTAEHDTRFGDPDLPLVYLSFGTQVPSPTRSHFPKVYRDAVHALAALPARILVAIGDRREPAELGPVPPSVRVERWVPQAAVMRSAAVTVGHGGAGSVLSALAAGVPMALVPFFADQPFNSRLIADLGAGLLVEDGTSVLGKAVRTLLDESRFRERAQRIADEIRGLPPIDAAVDALAVLVETRQAA
jgi:UDP:flavonoid glycosyltransferase YjiC (YdhE family)